MAVVETLAKGIIELGIDDIKLKDEVSGGTRVIADGLKQALNSTRLTADHMQKLYAITKNIAYLDTSRVKLQDQVTRKTKEQVQNVKQTVAETQKYAAIRRTLGLDGGGVMGKLRSYDPTEHIKTGMGIAGSVGGAVSGLAFAGAAAAGQTTLDTLTGSLKKLALAAGAHTQGAVLKLSQYIQRLGNAVENAPPGSFTVVGAGLTGAAIGGKVGGPVGAGIGAVGGILTGGWLEDQAQTQFYTQKLANKIGKDPKSIANAEAVAKRLGEQAKEINMGAPGGLQKIDQTIATRNMIRDAVAIAKGEAPGLKTAGLGMQGAFSGLGDLRQQAQLSVFAPGGELGAENRIKELELNQKVLNKEAVDELKGLRRDLKQAGVQAPANANP